MKSVLTIAVLGCGVMGASIARLQAGAGHRVRIYDQDPQAPLRSLIANDTAVVSTSDLRWAVAEADWIIETITENLAAKQRLLTDVDGVCRDDAIVTSNSSSFMPSELSSTLDHRHRFANTHFFRPANLAPLVEIVPAPWTHESVTAELHGWLTSLGKSPVTIARGDSPRRGGRRHCR
jgi:3-hydroxyacyl-CoA dehydrogenase